MEQGIEILSSGLYSSLQGTGIFGYRHYGLPQGGVMDKFSAALANQLVNNPPESDVIEITQIGPKILFHASATIAITGADLSPRKNGVAISHNRRHVLNSGDIMTFGKSNYGYRAYLAIGGEFLLKPENKIKLLEKGQFLPIRSSDFKDENYAKVRPFNKLFDGSDILVHKGPEFEELSKHACEQLFSNYYSISTNSDRMGIRLEGPSVLIDKSEILTGPIIPGTVQLPPSGLPIVLMKDCQTTGGYPRVLCLPEISIAKLAQKRPDESIRFELVDSSYGHT